MNEDVAGVLKLLRGRRGEDVVRALGYLASGPKTPDELHQLGITPRSLELLYASRLVKRDPDGNNHLYSTQLGSDLYRALEGINNNYGSKLSVT